MKLWLLEQNVNSGYDTYDSCVVAAEDESSAREIHPNGDYYEWKGNSWYAKSYFGELKRATMYDWVDDLHEITVTYLGEAKEGTTSGVICASFNAG